jgi:hypothetical protein
MKPPSRAVRNSTRRTQWTRAAARRSLRRCQCPLCKPCCRSPAAGRTGEWGDQAADAGGVAVSPCPPPASVKAGPRRACRPADARQKLSPARAWSREGDCFGRSKHVARRPAAAARTTSAVGAINRLTCVNPLARSALSAPPWRSLVSRARAAPRSQAPARSDRGWTCLVFPRG